MPISKIKTSGIEDSSVTADQLAENSVTSAKIGVDVIVAEDIANNAITVAELADNAVTNAKLADNAVDTTELADGAVTSAKLDTNIDIAGTLDVTGVTTLDSNVFIGGTNSVSRPTLDAGVYLQSQTNDDVIGYSLRVTDGVNNRRGSFFLDDTNGVYGMDVTATTSVPDFVVNRSGVEKIRVTDAGLTFNGDTAAANALDDYEEGTFNVTLNVGGTDSTSGVDCTYVKIGRMVFCEMIPNNSNLAHFNENTSASAGTEVRISTATNKGQLPFLPRTTGNGIMSWTRGVRSSDGDGSQGHMFAWGWVKENTQLYVGRISTDGNEYGVWDGNNSADNNVTLEKDASVSNVVLSAQFVYYTDY